ncbi:MAG: ATP-binding protein [Anaerolineae bacterium]
MAISVEYQVRQREYLLQIARAITAQLDLPSVLRLVIRYAVEILGGRMGLIALRRPDDTFAIAASYGVDPRLVPRFAPLLADIPLSVQQWAIPRLRTKLAAVVTASGLELGHVMALPMAVGERLVGVIYVFRSPGRGLFSALDQEVLAGFADQAAIAIENARLYGEMAARAQETSQLYEAALALTATADLPTVLQTVAQRACAVADSQRGSIRLYDREQDVFVMGAVAGPRAEEDGGRFPARPDGLTAAVIQRGEPILRDDTLAMPVMDQGQVIGVLTVSHEANRAFHRQDIRLLSTLAHLAAMAIQRARLFQAMVEEKQRLDAVIQGSAEGILILEPDGRVQVTNRALERLTGWDHDEAAGQPYDHVLSLTNEQGVPVPSIAFPPPKGEVQSLEGYVRRRDGGQGAYVYASFSPLYDAEGRLTSVVANVVDISQLKEAEEAKSTFLAGMSHELKTPLSLILGYAETLSRTDVEWDPETLKESLAVIREEAEHLTHLVDGLLDAAQIEARGLPLRLSETRLDQLAERLVAEFRALDQDHLWAVDFPPDFPVVRADPERIRQVLHNLLSNAAKYSPRSGLIRVAGWVEDERVGVSVSDEGEGIPFELQERIFERFYRGQGQRVRRAEGAGLGLYMARAIVEGHGGRIWVESMPQRGTTFYFTLPRSEGKGS